MSVPDPTAIEGTWTDMENRARWYHQQDATAGEIGYIPESETLDFARAVLVLLADHKRRQEDEFRRVAIQHPFSYLLREAWAWVRRRLR